MPCQTADSRLGTSAAHPREPAAEGLCTPGRLDQPVVYSSDSVTAQEKDRDGQTRQDNLGKGGTGICWTVPAASCLLPKDQE